MRKWIMLLLALSLLFAVSASAEDAAPALAAGTVTNGFEVTEVREYPALGAELIAMRHQKTGAKLLWVANDDTNRVFALNFATEAIDNTGLPHVFEHATLSGSEKFPSKKLFFNLSYQTYNTYMNAFTTDRITGYPVASLSEEQLYQLARFYLDCCFHPSVMTDESIWREEAWRYRLESEDAPLTLEGTVYSEMQGSLTLTRVAYTNWVRTIFPGSYLGNTYGGEPDFIPDMTWDALKDYHDTYYHPSNCTAVLYGKLDGIDGFLALLDGEFSLYEAKEFAVDDANYTALTEDVTAEYAYPTEAGADPANQTTIIYSFALPESAWDEIEQVTLMSSLLGAEESPLYQKLQKVLPTGKFSCGVEIAGPVPGFLFEIDSVNREDAELFIRTVEEGIADVAANGFPKAMIDAYAATVALQNRLLRENSELGTNLAYSVAYDAIVYDNLFEYFESLDAVSKLQEWNDTGVFAAACAKYLNADAIHATAVTYPQPGLREEKDAALAARLAEVKAAMSDEERAALIAAAKAEDEASGEEEAADDPTADLVRDLTAVTLQSLPEEAPAYEVADVTDADGVRWITAPAGVESVGRIDVRLDASVLDADELLYLKLYKDLIGYLDTDRHTHEELVSMRTRYLNGGTIGISLARINGVTPALSFSWTALDADLETGYGLIDELFFHLDASDPAKVADAVDALIAAERTNMNQNPYTEGLYRALGRYSPRYNMSAFLGGVSYISFLSGVKERLAADPAAELANLDAIRDRMRSGTGAAVIFAGDAAMAEQNAALAKAWLDGMGYAERDVKACELPVAAASEALILDTNMQFNGIVADYATAGLEDYDAGLDAVMSVVADKFLVPMLREQYGVYSPWAGAIDHAGLYLLTYRDPNVGETFAVYAQLGDLLENLDITQEELDGYILSSYSAYAMPAGELTGAYNAAYAALQGDSQDENVQHMRELKALTPEKLKTYGAALRSLVAEGTLFTVGSAAKVTANADLYETVLNPFGVEDATQVAFADLDESREDYAAVRWCYENGLMAPLAADAFGVDETATKGDMASALHLLGLGVPAGPAEAVATLSAYGIVPADADPAAPLSRGDIADYIGGLMAAVGQPLDGAAPEGLADGDGLSAAMRWCLENGVFTPLETEAGPAAACDVTVTRGELAAILQYTFGE